MQLPIERLFEEHHKFLYINSLKQYTPRYLFQTINWDASLIGLKGMPGTGKTAILAQYLKKYQDSSLAALYVDVSLLIFSQHTLVQLANSFQHNGGRCLVLDNVQKYPNWFHEVRQINKEISNLQLIFSGSFSTPTDVEEKEFWNQLNIYELFGFSFREYLEHIGKAKISPLDLTSLLQSSTAFCRELSSIQGLKYLFYEYLVSGYYPGLSHANEINSYHVQMLLNKVLENDLPYNQNIDFKNIAKIKKLLFITANSSPLRPNVSVLSEKIAATRGTIMQYIDYLRDAHILHLLKEIDDSNSVMAKPEKIYIHNTNLLYSLSYSLPEQKNVLETFVLNQLRLSCDVCFSPDADFLVNEELKIDIGLSKEPPLFSNWHNNQKTINLVTDLDISFGSKHPVWLLGFLY